MRPCKHTDDKLPEFGHVYVAGECRMCWLYVHDDAYRLMWGGQPAEPAEATKPKKMSVLEAKAKGLVKPCGCKK